MIEQGYLSEIFEFNEDDLYANRQGFLTIKQENALEEYRKGLKKGWMFSFAIILICVFIWSIGGFLMYRSHPEDFKQAGPYMLGALALFLGIYLFFALIGYIKMRDIRSGKISMAEGYAEKESNSIRTKGGRSLGKTYIIKLGKTKFIIPYPKQFEIIREGRYYKFYYIKTSHIYYILSVEEI